MVGSFIVAVKILITLRTDFSFFGMIYWLVFWFTCFARI